MRKSIIVVTIISVLASPFFVTSAASTNYAQPQASIALVSGQMPAAAPQLKKLYKDVTREVRRLNFSKAADRVRDALGSGNAAPADMLLPETSLD